MSDLEAITYKGILVVLNYDVGELYYDRVVNVFHANPKEYDAIKKHLEATCRIEDSRAAAAMTELLAIIQRVREEEEKGDE